MSTDYPSDRNVDNLICLLKIQAKASLDFKSLLVVLKLLKDMLIKR